MGPVLSALRAALLALLLLAPPAFAQTFPAQNKTRVVDAAEILPPQDEAALDTKLAAYETETGRQMVVATVGSLEGYPVEDYGYRLGRAWGIGSKEKDDGTLLLVAPNDRKVRIEVGYGVEPILTDAFSSVIINTQILPRFKVGDYVSGINAGTDAMIAQLKLTPEEAAQQAKALAAQKKGDDKAGAVIFWLFVIFFFVLPVVLPLIFGRRRGKRYRHGPVIIWGPGDWGGGGGSSWGGGGGGSWGDGGGFSGGGGSFGGGGSSGSW
ncbi:MAG: TPM domain-containing protein [Sphingomonadales bacterium]|jgi:uncharacterized protein|nr:TPM domain-containing protein [Sphingomonadales bacterium]